ncbi:MAG: hypothetical protein ACRDNT_04880 [Streptosporangiaceae bacterium]
MPRVAKGCVEQLPSGSWRARVYAGIDPITKREIRLKATAKTEGQAHIADRLILVRRGQTSIVAGKANDMPPGGRKRPGPGHDCRRAGCKPHVCHPMKASTIRGIHSILSGAFAAAQRWEWTDRNPAESAKPPTTVRPTISATSPEDVAKVIAEARTRNAALGLSWRAASTCATPPPASATAGAARRRCGTTPTRSPRSTGAPPHTSQS